VYIKIKLGKDQLLKAKKKKGKKSALYWQQHGKPNFFGCGGHPGFNVLMAELTGKATIGKKKRWWWGKQ